MWRGSQLITKYSRMIKKIENPALNAIAVL